MVVGHCVMADERKRNYACMVYPESAPVDWIEILRDKHIPAFVSPLHDQDIFTKGPEKGKPKKPHYHVMIMFEGKKTREQAVAVFDEICGVGCEVVESIRGYARYLCHLDEDGAKPLYSVSDVKELSGANYSKVCDLQDRIRIMNEIMDWCDQEKTVTFSQLMSYARAEKPSWFEFLMGRGMWSVRETLRDRNFISRFYLNSETGEIL